MSAQTATDKLIFLVDEQMDWEKKVIVAKESWFKWIPCCEERDQYGRKVECETASEDPETGCTCPEILAYQYWDGHNNRTVIIKFDSALDYDPSVKQIEDEAEIAELQQAIDSKKFTHETTGIKHFSALGWHITQSCWQGDWALFTMIRDEDEK